MGRTTVSKKGVDSSYAAITAFLKGHFSSVLDNEGMTYRRRSWREAPSKSTYDDRIYCGDALVADIVRHPADTPEGVPHLSIRVLEPAYREQLDFIVDVLRFSKGVATEIADLVDPSQ